MPTGRVAEPFRCNVMPLKQLIPVIEAFNDVMHFMMYFVLASVAVLSLVQIRYVINQECFLRINCHRTVPETFHTSYLLFCGNIILCCYHFVEYSSKGLILVN